MMRWLSMMVLLGAAAAHAQGSGTYARITVLVPKEGMAREFEDGYRRHLEWHKQNGDRWAWYGWTVATGERAGVFIDGTFGRTGEELDAPVAPAEDRADNAKNVFPHARLGTTAVYRFRPELSRGTAALLASPWATFATIQVRSGREKDFESALQRHRTDGRLVFELVSGGELGSYVVFVPGERMSQLLQRSAVPSSDAIVSVRTEAARYRPDLTYVPVEQGEARR
ncbi:MAG: hypothetical protein L0Y64_21655 [Myxococcaceae bacterium]|nr:hypothetical protein [Myxococcaceae bacterium]